MFRYLVLGQYSKFQVVHMLDILTISQFCTYMIFLPDIVKYGNINLNMHMESNQKGLFKLYFSTPKHLYSLGNNSEVHASASIFRLCTDKDKNLLPHCFSFIVLHHNRMIHIFSALLNCNESSFTNQILTA